MSSLSKRNRVAGCVRYAAMKGGPPWEFDLHKLMP